MKFLALILLILVSVGSAFADVIRLFDDLGNPVKNYDTLITNLKGEDILEFDSGNTKFKVEKFLGRGKPTMVFQVRPLLPQEGPSMALRLRRASHRVFPKFMVHYLEGAKLLEGSGIRIPEIYSSFKDQFIAVELVKVDFDLRTFLKRDNIASPEVMNEAEEALYKFAGSTSKYKRLGDFHDEQLVYDIVKKEWVLLDFTSGHSKVFPTTIRTKKNNVFYDVFHYETGREVFETDRARRIFAGINKSIMDRTLMGKCLTTPLRTFLGMF